MSSALPIPVSVEVLRWARQQSGYDAARVAKSLGVKLERLVAWEAGERQPTLRQVQNLAKVYRRPFGIFFQPHAPKLAPLAAEYRRLPGVTPEHESPELRLAIRQVLARRDQALELLDELGEPEGRFALRARLSEEPQAVAARIRAAAEVSVEAQFAWPSAWRAWAAWRSAVEGLGVFVFQFPGVALEEARGFALLRDSLPVVAVNSKESPEPRAFTLFHELTHLMLSASHEEAPALKEKRSETEWKVVEKFAESVASHVLVPEHALRESLALHGNMGDWSIANVRKLARRFHVSPLAMATRLRMAGEMTWPQYRAWRESWEALVSQLPPKRGGFASPIDKTL
ncbi:MAG: ImmA/IrrE family metallo-endopeptidase, partial [Candidatus Eisenbacteria bacterium]|nr:ImmA/IrrE family metallo-endopeptidase [Candidatus Eisenbacteria bacterium]